MTSDKHFEKVVEQLVEKEGPLTTAQITNKLAERRELFVINSSKDIKEEVNDEGNLVMTLEDPNLTSVSNIAMDDRLRRAWDLQKNENDRWELDR